MLFTPKTASSSHSSRNSNDSFFKSRVQPKLAVGKPGDKFEVEADKTADKVVNKLQDPKQNVVEAPASKPSLQQKKTETVPTTESGEVEVQEKSEESITQSITPLVQTSLLDETTAQPQAGTLQKSEDVSIQEKATSKETKKAIPYVTSENPPFFAPKTIVQHKANADIKPEEQVEVQPKLALEKPVEQVQSPAIPEPVLQPKAIEKPTPAIASVETATTANQFWTPIKPIIQQQKETAQAKEDSEQEEEIQEKPLEEPVTQLMQMSADEPVEEEAIQTKCDDCEEQPAVQQKSEQNGGSSSDISSSLSASKGGGSPMDESTSDKMSSGFGADFSSVRVHTDSKAVRMNKQLGSQAFANGSDIYFNEGKYNPDTKSGQHLLAHELTHTVQQGGAGSVVNKKLDENYIQRDGDSATDEQMNAIYDALSGWTDSDDSATILSTLINKSKFTIDEIISGVATLNESSGLEILEWMYSDMVTSDWKSLNSHFINLRVRNVETLIAKQIYSNLSGYTSESNSIEILSLFLGDSTIAGEFLDTVLGALEAETGMTTNETAIWLLGDMSSVQGFRLSQHFFNAGSVKGIKYAGHWIASKVKDLVSGYTGISDSQKIVANFQRVQLVENRIYVLHEYNQLSQEEWAEEASVSLMEDMQQEDYEQLRILMPGVLPIYNIQKNWLEWTWDKIVIGFDYVVSFLEYVVCGLAGVVWGVLSVVWDIIVLIWDLIVAIKSILGLIIYAISGGKFGREDKEAVYSFFSSMGDFFSAPGDAISKMMEEVNLEASLIEGPFTECQQSFFWTSRIVNLIVNIILIFAGGYGAAKLVIEGIEGLVKLIQAGELMAALSRLPGRMFRAVRGLPANASKSIVSGVSRVIQLIQKPAVAIESARSSIAIVRMAAAEEGYFSLLRRQAGIMVADESAFWRERRAFWTEKSQMSSNSLDVVETKLVSSVEIVVDDPARAEALVLEAESQAAIEQGLADNLLGEMKGTNAAANSALNDRIPIRWRSASARPPFLDSCVSRLKVLGYSDDAVVTLLNSLAGKVDIGNFFYEFNKMLAKINTPNLTSGMLQTIVTGLSNESTINGASFIVYRISNNQVVSSILTTLRFDDLMVIRARFTALSDSDFTRQLNHVISKMALTREETLLLFEELGENALTKLRTAVDRLGNDRYSMEQIRESLAYSERLVAAIAETPDEVANSIWGDKMTGRNADGQAMVSAGLTNRRPGDLTSSFIRGRSEGIANSILGGEGGTTIDTVRWSIVKDALLRTDLPTIVKNDILGEIWAYTKVLQYRNLGYQVIREVSIRILSESGTPTRSSARIDAVLKRGNEILYREFKSSATASTSAEQTTVYGFLDRGELTRMKPFGPNAETAFGGKNFPLFKQGEVVFERPPN